MFKKLSFIFLSVSILLLAGCQAKNATVKSAPPKQLDSIESNAEDIIDDITNNDWTAAQSKVTAIKTNFSKIKPKLVSASIATETIDGLSSAVTELETAVSAKKSYGSKLQANHISKYVPDIADHYTVTIPTDIGRLDYLGREISLNVENSDWMATSSNYETASSLWTSLKLKLNSTYKNDSDNFQSNMDNLKAAIDKKDSTLTTNQANILLENVDVLETDFTKQNKK